MKRNIAVIVILLGFGMISCSPSKTKQEQAISTMEARLYSPMSEGFSKASADSLQELYSRYIKDFPKDSATAGYLFKAAGLAMNNGNPKQALEYFSQLYRDFPDSPRAPLCLFFKGYVQETYLKDLPSAKASYEEFLRKYPDNDFSDDARAALSNLGKSPEEMVREFEANRRADSVAQASGKQR